ncbi:MAG TPA: alpha/beta hydrolase [Thermoanaerobaculaceae bacterium]|nr:alpha/beta hydrolase [Thermoanaerobaculaceae bacterium]HRS15102.1 alpha/beta hydrolase [Thermoanaerobaculaceae bacterium]
MKPASGATGSPPEFRSVEGPRGPVAFERWGEGPALLLLAGLGSRARLWGELPRVLSDRFTVLAPDNRGVGGSRSGEPFTLEGAADDAALVLTASGVDTAGVVGVSMGGLIACHLAARHPERVDHLVAASCAARLTPHHRRVLRFFELAFTRLGPGEAAEALMAFAFAAAFADRYPGFVDQAARLWTLEPEDLPGALQHVRHLQGGWDLRPLAARIACPTLVLAGELDPIVPAALTRELAAAIPEARYREVPGAAHSVLAEGGAALLGEIVEFLRA